MSFRCKNLCNLKKYKQLKEYQMHKFFINSAWKCSKLNLIDYNDNNNYNYT